MSFRTWLTFKEGAEFAKLFEEVAGMDDELLQKIHSGDDTALARLMTKWEPIINSFVSRKVKNKTDADEITQDAMLLIIKSLRKGTNPDHFDRWAYRIASNAISTYFRKNNKMSLTDDPEALSLGQTGAKRGSSADPVMVGQQTGIVDYFINDEAKELLQIALLHLEKGSFYDQRKASILKMRFFDGMKEEEVAKKLGIPLGTVKRTASHAREYLKSVLSKQGLGD